MTDHRTLDIQLDRRAMKKSSRIVSAVVSSENPVSRGDFMEVLSHITGAVRLHTNPLPLQVAHNTQELPVGVVENFRLEGDKGRADLRFGNSDRATEIWQDVKEGIIRNVSIGYKINDYESTRDGNILVTDWTIYEASIVAAPADNQTGIGRSMDCKENRTMSEHIEVKESQDDKQESQRILNINAIGKIANMRDLADKAIEDGTPYDVFQARAFTHMRYLLGWTELNQCIPARGSPPRQLCVANSRGYLD